MWLLWWESIIQELLHARELAGLGAEHINDDPHLCLELVQSAIHFGFQVHKSGIHPGLQAVHAFNEPIGSINVSQPHGLQLRQSRLDALSLLTHCLVLSMMRTIQ
jgi:hypothetical protein